jgi:hypothetical protein
MTEDERMEGYTVDRKKRERDAKLSIVKSELHAVLTRAEKDIDLTINEAINALLEEVSYWNRCALEIDNTPRKPRKRKPR